MAPIPPSSSPSMSTFTSPITEKAYIISQSVLLFLALANTIARTVIRSFKNKKMFADDYLLFVALACLIASITITFITYAAAEDYSAAKAEMVALNAIMESISVDLLLWVCIYCVKFSFMFYFRGLLTQQPNMMRWWWVVLVCIIPCAVASAASAFLLCPDGTAPKMIKCITSPTFLHGELITIYVSVFADIITDLLLLSIPCCLLKELQVGFSDKIGIGSVLCCSVFMIAIAILRGVSTYVDGTSDQIWALFWISTQANVAVIMVCFTSWRQLLVMLEMVGTKAQGRRRRKNALKGPPAPKPPRRGCWPWRSTPIVSDIHLQQLRQAKESKGTGSSGSGPSGANLLQYASANTNGTGPAYVPAGFPRLDSNASSFGMPELRRISRLLPGDRVLVMTEYPAAVTTESFV
ncbi:hypothetical protein MMC11_002784 [Xylographa trunciseda]|nr:hypothetical protein [Xylographa trunciseda]